MNGESAFPETAPDHAAFEGVAAYIGAFANGVRVISGPSVSSVVIIAVRAKGIIPYKG
jgi:hypothetical protein